MVTFAPFKNRYTFELELPKRGKWVGVIPRLDGAKLPIL